jgi:hypothetical protein
VIETSLLKQWPSQVAKVSGSDIGAKNQNDKRCLRILAAAELL